MGRPPEVFVRPVTTTEGRRLQRIGRTAKDPVKLRRAIVVLISARGQSAPDIAQLLDCSQEYVRGVIRAFHDIGVRGSLMKIVNEEPGPLSRPHSDPLPRPLPSATEPADSPTRYPTSSTSSPPYSQTPNPLRHRPCGAAAAETGSRSRP
jgi:hypothetical protein